MIDKAALKAFAHGIGFDLVGVASAGPFADEARVLAEREAAGARSPFEVGEIPSRTEPERLLPGARSFVSVAVCYLPAAAGAEGETRAAAGGPTGRLSRYARGQDYHKVLRPKLERLAEYIRECEPGARCRVSVDTDAPIDRAVAARAGVGWFGKNCALIAPPHGSWVFLGEVLTTAEIEPDRPLNKDCGRCRLCIDACPTGALSGPFQFNASRCLSQISQNREPIPLEFRRAMGDRIFGCDICQDVCPHNHAARPIDHPEFRPLPDLGERIDLARVLRMTRGEFRRWFGPSSAAWRGKTVLQRNAVVALGNSADPAALPLLVEALADPRPAIRQHAAWALGALGCDLGGEVADAARAHLHEGLRREETGGEPAVVDEIRAALRELGD